MFSRRYFWPWLEIKNEPLDKDNLNVETPFCKVDQEKRDLQAMVDKLLIEKQTWQKDMEKFVELQVENQILKSEKKELQVENQKLKSEKDYVKRQLEDHEKKFEELNVKNQNLKSDKNLVEKHLKENKKKFEELHVENQNLKSDKNFVERQVEENKKKFQDFKQYAQL